MRNEDLSATGVTGNQDSANEGAGVVPTVAMDAAQKSPVVVRADAIRVTPGPDGLVTLPAGVDLADIHVVGRDLVIDMPDGTQMIIIDGAVFVPQLIIGSIEVPPTNLAALLIGSEPQPAAGNPQSSGGNFAVDVPDLGPPAPLGDLLPPTELTYTPPEVRENSFLQDDDVEVGPNPTVLLDDDAFEGGNPGGDGDDSPDTANTGGFLSGSGNDTPLTWNFNFGGAPTGFTYVQDGDNLLIQQNGVTVIEVTLNPATGQYSVTQIAPIDHSVSGTEDNIIFNISYTVTDVDGDFADGILTINADDDTPVVSLNEFSVPDLLVDETDLGTDDDGVSFAGAFNVSFGADGDGGLVYSLTLSSQGVDSGLVDTATGEHIFLYNVGGGTVEGRVGGEGGPVAFVVEVDGSGNVSLDQVRALVHPDNPDNYDETIDIDDGVISLTATATDGDGDEASESIDLGGHLNFDDDGPSIGRTESSVPDLNVDETDLGADATGVSFASLFDVDFGADGDGGSAYSLTLSSQGADSGLVDTETGEHIYLYNVGDGTVEGRVGGEEGPVAFVVEIDGDGNVSLDQQRALVHPDNPDNYDETIDIDDGVISVTLTITDGDGDEASQSVDLGGHLNFDDDGPSIGRNEVSVPDLNVDETDLGADATGVSFASLFSIDFGADGDGGTAWSLTLSMQGADSGLVDTETGQSIFLYNNGDGTVEGRVGGEMGDVAFVVSVDGDGNVSLDQQRALVHPDNPDNYDETIDVDNGVISLTLTITDGDGDEASQSVDLGSHLNFDDDGPSVSLAEFSAPDLNVDETDLGTDDTGKSFAGAFDVDFGADGDGGVVYSLTLSMQGADSGLVDTETGQSIFLYNNGDGTVEGRVGGEMGAVAFVVSVNGDGNVSLDQQRAMVHPDNPDNYDETIDIDDGIISLTATATDGDGDEASASIDIGGNLNFDDDGPSIFRSEASVPDLLVDETNLAADDDNNAMASLFGVDFGADGDGGVTYALTLSSQGVDSGLDTTDGTSIFLYNVGGGLVEGRVGGEGGAVAFTITVDGSGNVSLDQILSLYHPDDTDHDDRVDINDGVISLTATATDGDGDEASASVDLGDHLNFDDDGPSINRSEASAPNLLVDETDLNVDDDGNSFAGLFDVDYGADGPGSVAYALTLASQGVDSGLDTTDGTSIFLYNNGDGTVEGRVGGEGGAVAFTITVDGNGNVSLDQILSLYHPDDTDHDDRVDINDGVISLTATVTDGDGDTADLSIDLGDHLNFDDDGPSVTALSEDDNSQMSVTSDSDIVDTANNLSIGTFFALSADYGADGPGAAPVESFSLDLIGDVDLGDLTVGVDSGFTSGGATVYLYQVGGMIVGSTAALLGDVDAGNTIFDLSVDSNTSILTQNQYGPLDHTDNGSSTDDTLVLGNGLVNGVYTVTIEDGDGDQDTDSATVDLGGNIKFNDDGPIAVDDEDSMLEGEDFATGNVITDADPGDAGDSDNGADDGGNDIPLNVVGVVTGSDDSVDTTNNGGGYPLVVVGEYGTLTINADGSYSYALNNADPDVNTLPDGVEIFDYFTYTIEDGDGDQDSAVLTITITGQNEAPEVTAVTTHVSEEGLGDGNEDTDPMGQDHTNDASVNGTFTFSDADGDPLTWSIATPAGTYYHADGTEIVWVQVDSHTVEGRYGAPDGAAVITVTVDDSGNWSATLHQPMDHGSDGNTESEFSISFDVTVDDGTEETVSSLTVYVEDDKPIVAIEDVDPHALQTDDTTLGTDDAEYGDAFSVLFGGDGPDGANAATAVEYTLAVNGGSTGLFDTATGLEVQLRVVGGVVEGYVNDGSDHVVFSVSVDGDGTVTLNQMRAVEHGDSPDNYNEPTNLVGSDLITLTATATDEDGDTDSKTIDLTGDISFLDDGPAVTATVTNESAGMAITDDDGSPSTDSFELGSIFGYNPDYGNDGQGAAPVESFLLSLGIADGGDSGLTSGGATIYLYINDAGTLVTASTSNSEGGVNGGNTVFTVAVDGDGTVTLTQSAPLDHLGMGNDAQIALPNGLIFADYSVTITDGDDDEATDTAQIDLGGNLKFNDDNPTIEGSAFNGTVILDETDPAAPYAPADPDGTNGSVPRASGTANLSTSFTPDYGADVPGDVTYGLSLNGVNVATGLYELDNSEADGQGLEIVLNISGNTVAGTAGPGGTVMFTIVMNADTGVITFTQFANLWHSDTGTDDEAAILNLAAGTLQATAYATDYDGDDSSVASVDLSVGVFQIEDSGVTLGTIENDLVVPNAGLTPTATGDFQYDVGTDGPQAGSLDGITQVLLSSVLVNGSPAINPQISYDAINEEWDFQFEYENSPTTTAVATGTISFDPMAGEYTVTLSSGPIEGFSIASTSGGSAFVGYEPDTQIVDGSQPAVSVTTISDDLFVQFTGVYEPASGTGANNLYTSEGTANTFDPGVVGDFGDIDLFTQASQWVSTSNTANGVGGDTIGGGEVLDFNLYSTNPYGNLGMDPTASAESMFIKLDGVGSSEDFIVILKLMDPDTGEFTTRAIMVQNDDIQKGPGTGPGAYSGITLDNNDGLVIIESNDYNIFGGENWVIVGAQIVNSDEGVIGNAINLDPDLNDGSADDGFQAFSVDADSGPFKISDIGFLTTTTLDQTVELEFDVTIKDGDGDSEQVTLNVTIDGVVENPLVANAVEKVAVGDTSMSSMLAANDDLVMVSRGNGTQSLMMASAVALMASHQSALIAKGIDTGFDSFEIVNTAQGVHTSVASQQAVADSNVDVGFDGDVREAIGSDGPAQSSHMVSREAVVEFDSADAPVEAANDAGGSDGGTAHTAAFAQDALVMPTADLSMPTAEALAAMEQGSVQSLDMVAKDVIEGLETGDDLAIDSALAGLEGQGKAIGLAEVASVPAWDMGDMGGFTHGAQAIMVAEAMVLHHDAVHSA